MEKKVECNFEYEEYCQAMTRASVMKHYIAFLIGGLLAFILGVFVIVFGNKLDSFIYKPSGYVICLFSLYVAVISFLNIPKVRSKVFIRRTRRATKPYIDGVKYIYTLKEDSFIVSVDSKEIHGSHEISYLDIRRIAKNEEYIYLFISKTSSFIIKKKDLSLEDIQFLESKVK